MVKNKNNPLLTARICYLMDIERNETMNINTTPENFTPTINQLCKVHEGDRTYHGSFTGSRYSDGGWQVYFKDSCGDVCRRSTNQITWSL